VVKANYAIPSFTDLPGCSVWPRAQIREGKTLRCVVAHELTLLRQGLRRLLEDEPDLQVVAEAENAAEALRHILELRPDVVIADARLFGCPPLQVEQMIRRESPQSRVVFLPSPNPDEPPSVLSDGSKHAVRHTSAEDLVMMVRGTSAFTTHHPVREVSEFPLDENSSRTRMLTAREREVLKLLAEGRTVRSVAGILGLSVKTVDAHKFNLMRKLGIHNKAELVMWAIQKKVVKLPANF
jgi:two-component system, NarL family, response regulator NreC